MCSTRRKVTSAPSKQQFNYGSERLAASVIVVVRLTILVDVVTITAGIQIILAAVDGSAKNAAKDCAGNRAGARADARNHGARYGSANRADGRAGGRAANLAVAITRLIITVVPVIGVIAVLVRISSAA